MAGSDDPGSMPTSYTLFPPQKKTFSQREEEGRKKMVENGKSRDVLIIRGDFRFDE